MNHLKHGYLLFLFSIFNLIFTVSGFCQDKKLADELFRLNNFEGAFEQYAFLLDEEPDNLLYNYRLAVCVLNMNVYKKEAISSLEKIYKNEEVDPNAMYLLGRAYQYEYRFPDAIKMFTEFEKSGKGTAENLMDAGRQIEHCQNAIELIKFPIDIKFENLGGEINSPFADYYPFASTDESFILFNSRRNNSGRQENGINSSDIYVSYLKNGKYTKAKPVTKKINSIDFDEEIVGMSSSNKKAVVYFSGKDASEGKLGLTDIKNYDLYNRTNLPEQINSRFNEIAATINNENKEIYFASDKPGGFGGTDLYVIRLLPNGDWGEAQNLGPAINTIYDEDFPVLSEDGSILYFSSKGHSGMGGYDIFRAVYDKEKMKFFNPTNVGYPLNTPYDEMNFSISESGRYGYISSLRKEGYGDLDIYRITFTDIEPAYTIFNGKIVLPDQNIFSEISMIVTNDETEEIFGEYLPNLNTMRYVIILPPGKYTLSIETDNFETYEEKISISDMNGKQSEISKDIELQIKK